MLDAPRSEAVTSAFSGASESLTPPPMQQSVRPSSRSSIDDARRWQPVFPWRTERAPSVRGAEEAMAARGPRQRARVRLWGRPRSAGASRPGACVGAPRAGRRELGQLLDAEVDLRLGRRRRLALGGFGDRRSRGRGGCCGWGGCGAARGHGLARGRAVRREGVRRGRAGRGQRLARGRRGGRRRELSLRRSGRTGDGLARRALESLVALLDR